MKTNPDDSAYPLLVRETRLIRDDGGVEIERHYAPGLTKREVFALGAMVGRIAGRVDWDAAEIWKMADAAIAAAGDEEK